LPAAIHKRFPSRESAFYRAVRGADAYLAGLHSFPILFCSVSFLLLNSDLSVSLHRTTKYVILSEALAESKNPRISSGTKQCFRAKIPRLRSG